MEYRSLGASGLKVPVLCLGAMTFGEADDKSFMHKVGCDEKMSFAIMSRALEKGVSFIDTADVYGQDGLSERIVGSWMAEARSRDRVVLATTFRFRMGEGPNATGASRYRIVRTAEDSLRRLKTDRIDLYQIHMQDIETPEEETLRALDDLVRAGKVLYLGASNYAAYRLTDSQWIFEERAPASLRLPARCNTACSSRELRARARPGLSAQFGLGVLPWSPLAAGFLSGKYARNQAPPAGGRLEKWKSASRPMTTTAAGEPSTP